MNDIPSLSAVIPGHDTLVPLRDVPKLLPPRPNGKRIHISACYRWITRGVRGVTLEVVKIGGSTYTSLEAISRFAAALAPQTNGHSTPAPITSRSRQRRIDQAAYRLRELLK
jgi:hypothetical protein